MTSKSYEKVMSMLNTINHITGLRNYTSFKRGKLKFLCTWLYSIFLTTVFGIIMYAFNITELKLLPYNLERIVYTFLLIVQMVGFMCIAFLGLYHSKTMLRLMKRIGQVDESLRNVGCRVDYRKVSRHLTVLGFVWILGLLLITTVYGAYVKMQNLNWKAFASLVTYVYVNHVGSAVLCDFNVGVYWLGQRFKEVNKVLKTLLENDEPRGRIVHVKPKHNRGPRLRLDRRLSQRGSEIFPSNDAPLSDKESSFVEKTDFLQRIRLIHLELCCTAGTLNGIFDMQLLIYTAIMLVYVTAIFYYIYMELHRIRYLQGGLSLFAIYMLDVLTNAVKISIVSYTCEYTTDQAIKVIEIIHASSLHQRYPDLKDEIMQFSFQISQSQLGKSKSTFFRLNYTFIRDCVSFVTTYLVIVIQWSQGSQADDFASSNNYWNASVQKE